MTTPVDALPTRYRVVGLHGVPCGMCGTPARLLEVGVGWTRVWHTRAVAPCDTGNAPTTYRRQP